MEIMLDRTHSRDDNLGMGEAIADSVRYRQQVGRQPELRASTQLAVATAASSC